MSIYPKIQSPCPYKGDLSAIMNDDVCTLCNRRVFDLTDMSDAERVAFMSRCGQVCVSYKFPLRAAAAAAIAVAAVVATPLAAAADPTSDDEAIIVVGGMIDPANVSYITDPRDASVPEAPVVYERPDTPAAQAAPTSSQPAASHSAAARNDAAPGQSSATQPNLGNGVDHQ
jgi:hypothetical protein